MKLNFKKLKTDINRISNQIKFMRSNRKPIMGEVSIEDLKREVTVLCAIRAEHRQKLHRQKVRNPYAGVEGQPPTLASTREEQVRLIQVKLHEYQTVEHPVI